MVLGWYASSVAVAMDCIMIDIIVCWTAVEYVARRGAATVRAAVVGGPLELMIYPVENLISLAWETAY